MNHCKVVFLFAKSSSKIYAVFQWKFNDCLNQVLDSWLNVTYQSNNTRFPRFKTWLPFQCPRDHTSAPWKWHKNAQQLEQSGFFSFTNKRLLCPEKIRIELWHDLASMQVTALSVCKVWFWPVLTVPARILRPAKLCSKNIGSLVQNWFSFQCEKEPIQFFKLF